MNKTTSRAEAPRGVRPSFMRVIGCRASEGDFGTRRFAATLAQAIALLGLAAMVDWVVISLIMGGQ
jgi:hypothetical protein